MGMGAGSIYNRSRSSTEVAEVSQIIVLGVDPGTRSTGLAVRDGGKMLGFTVLTNPRETIFPAARGWLREVVETATALAEEHGVELIAVESLRRPNWHVKGGRAAANPTHVIGTAQVLGAVQAMDTEIPIVEAPPGKNGGSPLGVYPEGLVPDGERRKADWQMRVGGGQLRHARSAWDCCGSGLLIHLANRQRSAS